MKILIIDDDEEITKMVTKFFKHKGYECSFANDGKTGVSMINNQRFDIVLLDMNMPEFNGYDVLDSLKKNGKIRDQKIIIFSVLPTPDEKLQNLIKDGVHSSIDKPLQLNELLKSVQNAYGQERR